MLVRVETRAAGSRLHMFRKYNLNPQAFAFNRNVSMQLAPTTERRYIEAIHYISSSMILKNKRFIHETPCKALTVLALFPGLLWYGYIRFKTRGL